MLLETKDYTNTNALKDALTSLLSGCHNIIRNNDKLSPEAAFDEISKVLFMKILFEQKSGTIFSKETFIKDEKHYDTVIWPKLRSENDPLNLDYLQYLFGETKSKFKDDGIFDAKDQIRIKRDSFEMILSSLEILNLGFLNIDITGAAFERFLGKTFRSELGQFFTPRTVVDYMIDILDPKEDELIYDPCCGSGGFLVRVFQYVKNKIDTDIRNQQKSPSERHQNLDIENSTNTKLGIQDKESRYYNLSHNCIFGTDANPRMARTAKMNMILHGDGHGGIYNHDGLLNIDGIFDNRFDIILTNPPYGARVEKYIKITEQDKVQDTVKIAKCTEKYGEEYLKSITQVNNNIGKSILNLYDLSSISNLTEVLFIERCLNLLKPGGRMGIVLPEGIMNNAAMQKVREYVNGRAKILNITSIPQDVFITSGATVKSSILFLQKLHNFEIQDFKNNADYNLILAEIKDAGITSIGDYSENNQFPLASQEFHRNNLSQNQNIDNQIIKVISSAKLFNWSVAQNDNEPFQNIQSKYENVALKDILISNKNTVKIDDSKEYKRITIRINNKGIVLRDIKKGAGIGTKRQFVIKKGQLAISKIDARHGAMGIIPEDLDGAIVTADFLTYDINEKRIQPEYLELIISTQEFVEFCQKFSSGTTNRQRLNQALFLNALIPIPSLYIQQEMVKEITQLKETIRISETKLIEAKENFEKAIFKI